DSTGRTCWGMAHRDGSDPSDAAETARCKTSGHCHLLAEERQRRENSIALRRVDRQGRSLAIEIRLDDQRSRHASIAECGGVFEQRSLVGHTEQDQVVRPVVPLPSLCWVIDRELERGVSRL